MFFICFLLETFNEYDNELSFECTIRANPKPKIIWYKGQTLLGFVPDKNLIIYTHPDRLGEHTIASVTFNYPTHMHCGTYTCIAENSVGRSQISHECTFMTEDEFYARMVKNINENKKIHSLDKLNSRILIQKEKEAKGKPQKRYAEPYKPIILDEEQQQVRATDIYYKRLLEARARKEAELAKNRVEPEPEITIGNDAEFITKQFCVVTHLLNQTVLQGRDLHLSWCVKAFDDLEAKWTKNGQLVAFGNRILSNVTKDGLITLEIHRAELSDSGKYRCQVKSKRYGTITQECHVTVFKVASGDEQPEFTQKIKGNRQEQYYLILNRSMAI